MARSTTQTLTLQRALAAAGFDPGALDGLYGPRTAAAASAAAAASGVAYDGSEASGAALVASLQPAVRPQPSVVGVWVASADWNASAAATNARKLAALGITDVSLVANDASNVEASVWHLFNDGAARTVNGVRTVKRRATATGTATAISVLRRAFDTYAAAGLRVHIMVWLRPDVAYLEAALADLTQLCAQFKPASVQFDAEERWITGKVTATVLARVALLFSSLDALGVPSTVTTYAGALPDAEMRALLEVPKLAGILLQVYATSSSDADPGDVQQFGHIMAERYIPHTVPVAYGLPAYRQSGIDGYTPNQAMAVQLDTALKYTLIIWYWAASSFTVDGYAAKFAADRFVKHA